jgi:glycosyltransferase involved in cell wall biosynthesis
MGPSPQKNHFFILEILGELARRDRRYYLYMAGDGPLRPNIEQAVWQRGLEGRVIMPGLSNDVPSLMVHGFDVHLLPSLFEGLPVVGLEAVASGLYTICSDTITRDFTDYFASRITMVSLTATPEYWADRVEEAVQKRISPREGISLVEQSPFSIQSSLSNVISLYRRRLERFAGDNA